MIRATVATRLIFSLSMKWCIHITVLSGAVSRTHREQSITTATQGVIGSIEAKTWITYLTRTDYHVPPAKCGSIPYQIELDNSVALGYKDCMKSDRATLLEKARKARECFYWHQQFHPSSFADAVQDLLSYVDLLDGGASRCELETRSKPTEESRSK